MNLVVECLGWTSEWKIVIPPRELRARDVPNNATKKGKEKQKQNHEKALQNEIVKVGSAEGLKLRTHALLKQGFNDCNLIVATELFHHLLQCLSFFPCSPPPPPFFFLSPYTLHPHRFGSTKAEWNPSISVFFVGYTSHSIQVPVFIPFCYTQDNDCN